MTKTKLGHEVEAASRGAAAVVVTSKRRPWVLMEAGAGREEQMKARAPRTMVMDGNRQLREAEGSGEVGRIWSLRHPAAMLEQGTGGARESSFLASAAAPPIVAVPSPASFFRTRGRSTGLLAVLASRGRLGETGAGGCLLI